MKVVIVQEQVDLSRGGAETSVVETARRLAELGLDVTVVCRASGAAPLVDHNVTYLPLAVRGPTRAWQTYRFIQAVHELCRNESFDIVHAVTPCLCAHIYQPRGGTYAESITRSLAMHAPWLRALKRLGRRFNVRQRLLFRLEQHLLRKRRQRVVVAAVSNYVRAQVIQAGFPGERVRVVFNAVDVVPPDTQSRQRLRAELGVAEAVPLVLFVAHNFRLKGLRQLLLATAHGRHDWHVAVLGRDNPRPYLRLARRLGIAQRVRFVGAHPTVTAWYAAADALAHPTWYDPCSRVVLEALSLGLPAVTTRYNGAAEIMQPGRHGMVIKEPHDIPGLAAAIETALQPATRAACRADAPRLAEQLSTSRHARELYALYQERGR